MIGYVFAAVLVAALAVSLPDLVGMARALLSVVCHALRFIARTIVAACDGALKRL